MAFSWSYLVLTIAIGIFASLLIWTISDWIFRHYGSWGPVPVIVIGTVVVASLSALSGYMYSKAATKQLEAADIDLDSFNFSGGGGRSQPGPTVIYLGH